MAPLRKCRKCGKEANTESELELFPKQKKGKYGRRGECKKCFAKYVEDKRVAKGLFRTRRLVDRHWIRDLVCKECGVQLTDENWITYVKAKHDYKCRPCYLKQRNEYYYSHKAERRIYEQKRRQDPVYREKENKRGREYGRKYRLRTYINGEKVDLRITKRPYSQTCELCGVSESKGLRAYHHWNPDKPENGMWLCTHCHIFANRMEKSLDKKYCELKAKIDGGGMVIQ
jgi:hypothetical protein